MLVRALLSLLTCYAAACGALPCPALEQSLLLTPPLDKGCNLPARRFNTLTCATGQAPEVEPVLHSSWLVNSPLEIQQSEQC